MSKSSGKAMTAEEARQAMMEDPSQLRGTTPVERQESTVTSIREDLRTADKLYTEAVDYARSFMDDAKEGRSFDFNDATPLVNDLIDLVFRNDSAAAAISKLKAFDEYTYTHCINVSVLSIVLGKRLGYSREQLELIGKAGMFHDVGKSAIPSCILNKPGKLNEREMNIMRTHPIRGFQMLKDQRDIPEEVLRGALEHHEKHDGSGYPRGLKGESISEVAKLLAVVDVYDALTSKRVYKDPMPPSKVLGMMYQWRVTDFYPNIVEQFIKSLGVYPIGSFVQLSTGERGVVINHTPDDPLNPLVKIVYDRRFRQIPAREVDLTSRQSLHIKDVINPDDYGIDVYRLLQ